MLIGRLCSEVDILESVIKDSDGCRSRNGKELKAFEEEKPKDVQLIIQQINFVVHSSEELREEDFTCEVVVRHKGKVVELPKLVFDFHIT